MEAPRVVEAIEHVAATSRLRRALVVEDDPTFRSLVTEVLSQRGFCVRETDNPDSALRLLSTDDFDVVITNLLLPNGSALELVRQARQSRSEPAVVVMSGYLSREVGRQAFLAGATDFLEKPFTRERLLGTLPTY